MNLQEQIRNDEYYRTLPNQKKQDEVILETIKSHDTEIGASEIYKILHFVYPITSIRRSLNTLANDNKIICKCKGKSVLYNSVESKFTINFKQAKLF